MTRAPKLEETIAALQAAKVDPTSESSLAAIRNALAHRNNLAAAKAAALVGQQELSGFTAELSGAFERFMADPGSDKNCAAKAAIAEALYRLGHDDPALFLRGIHHVQMEPVFGGRVDTAVDLRGACALGLVRMGYRDVLVELAQLLADAEPPARISAARAIAYRGGEDGAPLLYLKARSGDEEPQVVVECLSALLKVAPRQSLAFVASFLPGAGAAVAEGAALVLGASRLPEAFSPLREWADGPLDADLRRSAFVALATLRQDDAFTYLLDVVSGAPPAVASLAIDALAIYRDDEAVRRRTAEAAASREERTVHDTVARAFGRHS